MGAKGKSLVATVFAILVASSQASVVRMCEEQSSTFEKARTVIPPPEAETTAVEVQQFCSSNPHGFGLTSVSPAMPKIRPKCYQSDSGEVVLEIPDQFFNDCREDEYFELLIDKYAFKWASENSESLSIIIYNEEYELYRRGDYEQGSEIFRRASSVKKFNERVRYVMERVKSEEYDQEDVICIFKQKKADGSPCPVDILNKFPSQLSPEMLAPRK